MIKLNDITNDKVNTARTDAVNIISAKNLTHEQKVFTLANKMVSLLDVLDIKDGITQLMDTGIICDLNEGAAPMRPRYILPDYRILFEKGCDFLKLDPPNDLYEAINALQIFYKHVPSVTNYPVYIGNLDTLLEPFVKELPYEQAKKALKLFLIYIDRSIPDSFCHANIGPNETKTGRILMELEQELLNAVPNLTIKYDSNITPDSFAVLAIKTQLAVSKPAFGNHAMFVNELGEDYGLASCYNGLHIGGGAYTLVRVLLGRLAKTSSGTNDFFARALPECLTNMAQLIDKRTKFIVEETNFFESNFLSQEGFINKDNFTSLLGIVGLAECVNALLKKDGCANERYGHSETADNLGIRIMDFIKVFNKNHINEYCVKTGRRFLLHAQVGIETDTGDTAGVRIPIGDEPLEMCDHLDNCAKFHHYFPSGVSEIFRVESTALNNPEYVLDIIKGAFKKGVRYLCFHDTNSDVIRITGYLVKRSEIEMLGEGRAVITNTTVLGKGSVDNSKILDRKAR